MNHLPRPVYIPMRLVERYFKDGVAHAAAELAFFLLFSLFPLLMVLNSLLGLAHLSEVTILNATRFLPTDVQQILVNYMNFLGSNDSVRPLLLGSCLTLYFLFACGALDHVFYAAYLSVHHQPYNAAQPFGIVGFNRRSAAAFGGKYFSDCGRTGIFAAGDAVGFPCCIRD